MQGRFCNPVHICGMFENNLQLDKYFNAIAFHQDVMIFISRGPYKDGKINRLVINLLFKMDATDVLSYMWVIFSLGSDFL